jgi:hypothetical protein
MPRNQRSVDEEKDVHIRPLRRHSGGCLGQGGHVSELDHKVLDRVRKLLAKAEHPGTPVAEAQAFSAKASALMAAYAIDQALLEAGQPSSSVPVVRQVDVDPPYAMPRAVLLDRVARAHRVRVVIGPDAGSGRRQCSMVGFPVDLEVVEVLFTSLLLQASTAMLHASSESTRPKAFRRAFLLGYADVIGSRLAAVRQETDAYADRASTGAALVLADRADRVERLVEQEFPRLRNLRMSTSSGGGLSAGRAAGARADLSSAASRVGEGRRREIG